MCSTGTIYVRLGNYSGAGTPSLLGLRDNPNDWRELRTVILDVNRYFESKGQSSNRSLQYFHVLHSTMWPARMRCRDHSVIQAMLYAQASETSGCQALLICQRPRLSPPSPLASGWC